MGLDDRIGERFLRAGPAYGGSCFPKDTKQLIDTGINFKTNLSIVKTVVKSNENRKKMLTKRILTILKNKIKNKQITFLGVTFKPNTDDMREACSLNMIPYLSRKGVKIKYFDPSGFKKEFLIKKYRIFKKYKFCIKGSDLIIIHTEWNEFKFINLKK